MAASDYLDPLFLPHLVAHIKHAAPNVQLDLMPLSAEFDVRRTLAAGEVDLVVGNWLEPPEELHLGRLLTDEVVCLVSQDHPAVRGARGWSVEKYLACEHVAPTPFHTGRDADPSLGLAFIAAARGMLAPDGALWLVANRHLPYDAALSAAFLTVEEAGGDSAFRVIRATRPRRRP